MLLLALFVAAAPQLTVDQIVARHVQARGGAAALAALKSLRTDGKIVFGGFGGGEIEAATSEIARKPDAIRREVSLQGLLNIDAFDGRQSWTLNQFQGRRDAVRTAADEANGLAEDADFEGPLVDAQAKGNTLEYLGTEDVDGTPALKLRVSLKNGDTLFVFLDPDYFLEIRRETHRMMRGAERVFESDFGSYVQVNGVWIPGSIDTGRKGGPRGARYTLLSAEGNPQAPDSLFAFPSGKPGRELIPPEHPAPLQVTAPPAPKGGAAVLDSGVISGIGARNIGSAAMSGRIAAVAAYHEDGKTIVYVGAASGGVWKSSDGGTTFKPVFDKQPVQSIGALAVDPTNPKTVWVGTGESWMRNTISIGDGVYKTTDGGETWQNMGLPKTEHIVRIVVSPKDGNTVYVCAPGALWSDSPDRGLYKTTDGGKTWDLILTGPNLSTGCSTLAMDPTNPDVLYAGLWDFRRKGWTFRSGGNGGDAPSASALYKSIDGGANWTELTPSPKPWGRTEVVIAPSNHDVVYAFVESKDSALWRSADGGRTWERRDNSQWMVWRPFYFARMAVDPTKPDRLFKCDGMMIASDDGGKTFQTVGGFGPDHGDWHDLWIDPVDPKHIIAGNDGGLFTSYDGGNRWVKSMNLPISQFYHVTTDDRIPYEVFGGLQDNGTWIGQSAYGDGIGNAQWEAIYGGDGFWAMPDPSDPDAVYAEAQGGYLGRVDRKLGLASREIQPKAGYKEKLRYNWNAPVTGSPTNKKTVYIGAQFLFRTQDRGQTWERISPDLTTNDPEKQKQEESGGVTIDNSAAEEYTTIYSISESPFDEKVIWAGTDDGNVQVTRDGGKSWTNVRKNIHGLPRDEWTSWVEASRHDKGTAYAAFDRHTFGDFAPYVYRTTDFGKTWTRIVSPQQGVRGYAWVIREDSVSKSLLFCGTEFGLWISIDAGKTWAQFKGGDFPAVAVRDLVVQQRDNDLVIATHGRGIWIIDDITPLRALSAQALAKDAEFLPERPVRQQISLDGGAPMGDAVFEGPNPPGGAVITYYQRTRHLFGPIKIEVLDESGKVIDTVAASKRRGINRASWSMQVKPPRVPRAASVAGAGLVGPRVVPGTYTVRLTKGAEVIETKLPIELDPRAPWTLADRKEQFDAAMRAHALFGQMSDLVDRIDAARKTAQGPLADKLDALKKKIVATKEGGAITGEERIREHADHLYGALLSWEGKPSQNLLDRIVALQHELDDVRKDFEALGAK